MTLNKLTTNIASIYGKHGQEWLKSLPETINTIACFYHLIDLTPLTNLSYNYVLSGFQNEQAIILKLGLDHVGLQQEAAALKAFAGYGAARVFAQDDGALIIERAVPGVSLKSYFPDQDQAAIAIASKVMLKLQQAPMPSSIKSPYVKDWLAALDQDLDIPDRYLCKARMLRDELLATSSKEILLHGDLHHDNILSHGDDWLVIDPKGVIGESAYEVAAFIRNPIPELLTTKDARNIVSNRIALFSINLPLPKQRIADWCFVQAVLAWAWALEDNCDHGNFRKLTEIFARIKL